MAAHNIHEWFSQTLGDISKNSRCSICLLLSDAPLVPILYQPLEEAWPRRLWWKQTISEENRYPQGRSPTVMMLIQTHIPQWYPPDRYNCVEDHVILSTYLITCLRTCLSMSASSRMCWFGFLRWIVSGSRRGELLYSYLLYTFITASNLPLVLIRRIILIVVS